MSTPTRPLTPGTVSRRSLLQGLTALGVGASLFGAAGCESAVSQANAAGDAGTPQRGGTIRAGIAQDVIPGNFLTNSNTGITVIIGLAYDFLIRYPNSHVEPTPALATAWKLAADGRSLTLELRDDVTFHSGRPFTSKDVEFSIKTYADPLWTAQLRSTAAAITSFDTSEEHVITLGFDHPLGNVFDLLDTVPILDSESIDELRTGATFVGTGPFQVSGWKPNTSISFTRNDTYWVPERPYADGVEVTVIPDPKALLAALKSGQVQFANGLSSLDVENLTKGGDFTKIRLEGAEKQLYVGSNVTAAPLDDVRVRQAIAYAVDKERVVSDVVRGAGYTVSLPWPKYSAAFDEAANATYARDVTKAKGLVAEVGPIPTLPLTYQTGPLQEALAAIVQSNLADVGHHGGARPGRRRPVRQAADRGAVQGSVDRHPLLGAVHPVHADGQRLPLQRPQERLPLRLGRLHHGGRRRLEDPGRRLSRGGGGLQHGVPAAARRGVPGRGRDLLGAVGDVVDACRGPATPSGPSCCSPTPS